MLSPKSFELFGLLTLFPLFGAHKFVPQVAALSTKPLSWSLLDDQQAIVRANHCTTFKVEGHWVTAGHCVLGEDNNIAKRDYQIEGAPAHVVKVDRVNDIAMLAVDPVVLDEIPTLELAKASPTFGDFMAIVGHPYGWADFIVQVGTVANPVLVYGTDNAPRMLMNAPGAPGDSGAPVFDKTGRVIGVEVGGFCWSPFGDAGFCPELAAVTYDQLKAFVEAK